MPHPAHDAPPGRQTRDVDVWNRSEVKTGMKSLEGRRPSIARLLGGKRRESFAQTLACSCDCNLGPFCITED